MTTTISKFLNTRDKARKLASKQPDQLNYARRFLSEVIEVFDPLAKPSSVKPLRDPLATEMAELARQLDVQMAAYLIGTTYTVMLPKEYRGQYGAYYTPPALVERLLDLAEEAGVNWAIARVVDPACGGGAFLAPIAERMKAALSHLSAEDRLLHIEAHLEGFELDPFSAWISQVFLEIVLREDIALAKRPLQARIAIRDSLLTTEKAYGSFDLVIGNPPYGKVKLSKEMRKKWHRSLYGHANYYGLFSDLAVHLVKSDGAIAYVTPTSFLGGEYFKALRRVLRQETPPMTIDFIAHREGVFADVLQEALLAVYKKDNTNRPVQVSYLSVMETGTVMVQRNGAYTLPLDLAKPWILPRNPEQSNLAEVARHMPHRLVDLGYSVSTGPLVWNRHKTNLLVAAVPGAVPVIWAESVDSQGTGKFTFKASERKHVPWYRPTNQRDSNLISNSCVLLQRTTSLEQPRRLIAAELPQSFIDESGGAVTVENHLNMIRPIPGHEPHVPARVIAALLNSETVDRIFRCINGSTAVSAYELEAMPLPNLENCAEVENLLAKRASKTRIDDAIKEMYCYVRDNATA